MPTITTAGCGSPIKHCADIAAGEEVTVNYNGDPTDQSPLGFEVI